MRTAYQTIRGHLYASSHVLRSIHTIQSEHTMTQPNDFNQQLIAEFRANGGETSGPFKGRRVLLLTSTGARSGQLRTTPLVYSNDGDNLIVVASKGGAPSHPAWYHNLVAHPNATVEVGTDEYAVRAHVAGPGERERLYAQHAADMPAFNDYQTKTTRQIPVLVLERA
ncbi:MAG TPA: nitroreductase family deazaflavin-dependent oxidoreductase [Tepidiformaceae bacterium]|nr:nitroreductase family deazaflavin-dependent oxidoreductase [Tepidiformaceae bacterium]